MKRAFSDSGWQLVGLDADEGKRWYARSLSFDPGESAEDVLLEIAKIKCEKDQAVAHFVQGDASRVVLRVVEGI